MGEAEPFGNEALAFVKEMCLQREVEIEVENIDKGDNFIGWLFVDNTNVSVSLCEEGYAGAFIVGNASYNRFVEIAQDNAKRRKERRWANYVEEVVEEKEEEKETETERKVKYEKVVV